jgi:SAM-dependent methyltransferase
MEKVEENDDIENCPLCKNPGKSFHQKQFFKCSECSGIFRGKKYLPDFDEEKKRYELHNNDIYDEGYQIFVSPLVNLVKKNFSNHNLGLDFGSGAGPVISSLLENLGYQIKQFDPIFHNDLEVLELDYDYIVCCEVIEHFHFPEKEFQLLKKLLKPGGHLYFMTHIYDETIDFGSWYYKNDPTHVFLYQKETFEWIKSQFNFSSVTVENRVISLGNL